LPAENQAHSVASTAGFLMRRRSALAVYIRLNTWLWRQFPSRLRRTKLMLGYGTILHKVVRRAQRRQFTGTFFFRNRPLLELMRRLIGQKPAGSTLNVAILGCSIGAEIYSTLSTIRGARPDLKVRVWAVDNSPDVLNVAKQAVYTSELSDLVGSSIFERMTEQEFEGVFESDGGVARVRPWLREGISWHAGDAGDPALKRITGVQDIVMGSNFLCHMKPAEAESCLRNLACIVKPGGYLFVTGVDLDVRTKVASELGWRPVLDLIEEIHEGDPAVRGDWPCKWWGLEPLNKNRADWQIRYASAFVLNENG
jgi:chemotaxis methyl-accepting protein methylase